MRRRTFVAGGGAALGSLFLRPLRAQEYPATLRRAAVVIGLDKTGDLPLLHDAVQGAKDFAAFLKDGGFDPVLPILSTDGPVKVEAIKEAIHGLVDPPVFDQLVVYFAGHGIKVPLDEMWLLSDAPEDHDAAISVLECREIAATSGIANVVLIGDTCRSAPPVEYLDIRGSVIFPDLQQGQIDTEVDVFYACRPGQQALEVQEASGGYRALMTRTLLDVFRDPGLRLDPGLFEAMPDGSRTISNRKLRDVLPGLVDARAQAADIKYSQKPHLMVYSDDPWNVGKVAFPPGETPSGTGHVANFDIGTVSEVLQQQLQHASETAAAVVKSTSFEASAAIEQTDAQLRASVEVQMADIDLDQPGIAVYGAGIVHAFAAPGIEVSVTGGDGAPSVASVGLGDRAAATVLVRFANGTGVPIAVLREFGTHVTVGEEGATDLRYTPVRGSGPYEEFVAERDRLTALRALVRDASKQGVLGFDGNRSEREAAAARMADQIRMLKQVDPTLGIYAAYAYDAALLPDKVQSVAQIMRDELGVRLFDPEMLSRALAKGPVATAANGCFPFCPILRQGWELLRVKQVELADPVLKAQSWLLLSFITSFSAQGVEVIADAIERGLLA